MTLDVIRQLPDAVANQIAAGEVIQRPASVIKELVENSIDAGATSVQIIIKDAGRTLIQVIDNGKGMSPTDARMAFERHATSKISTADDLYSLHTMGFRGEALPSIAAVAQVELRTRPADETIGCCLRISESRFDGMEPDACAVGTNIAVRNIFFHMPARRKFLKKDNVELSHILKEFERLALVNTSVEFTIIHNGVTLHQLTAGTLKRRITQLFGKSIEGQIVPVGTETSMVKISGFIGLPSHARKRSAPQFFFVNGRNMRHPYFHKAVINCYSELVSPDAQPAYFINFEVDPATIDVNIHPQKHEIKFENEQPIWQILTAAVRQALGRINAAGAIDFDSPEGLDIPVFLPDESSTMPGIDTDPNYNPFDISNNPQPDSKHEPAVQKSAPAHSGSFRRQDYAPDDWDKLFESFTAKRDNPVDFTEPAEPAPPVIGQSAATTFRSEAASLFEAVDDISNFITLDNRFIALPTRAGLMLIHRRRAHMRVLFDNFARHMAEAPLPSQRLIFPDTVTLTPSRSAVLSTIGPMVQRLGYDVSFLGDNVWAINAAPALPGNAGATDTLVKLVADIEESGDIPQGTLVRPAAIALARSAAITSGQEMTHDETDVLIRDLMSCTEQTYTPDGLKIIHIMPYDEIRHLFA